MGTVGVSDVNLADKIISSVLGKHPAGKISSIVLKLFSIGQNVHDAAGLIKDNQSKFNESGLYYLDQIFLMDPGFAKEYFGLFELEWFGNEKPINMVGLHEAEEGMASVVNSSWDILKYSYLKRELNKAADFATNLTIDVISIGLGILGL